MLVSHQKWWRLASNIFGWGVNTARLSSTAQTNVHFKEIFNICKFEISI